MFRSLRFSRGLFCAGVVGTGAAFAGGCAANPVVRADEECNAEGIPFYEGVARPPIQLIAGNAHPELAGSISELLGVELASATVNQFRCGETQVIINESVRDRDVYVIQPTCNPRPNDYIMELVIICDALRRGGANRVTAVLPIFGYARQDKKDKSRAPISAKVIADMIHNSGADRVIAIDLHASQIQGFVNFPLDNLYGAPLIEDHIKDNICNDQDDLVIVSPDVGGAKRAEAIAKKLHADFAIFSKKRERAGEIAQMTLVGDVKGKTCVLVDDMCDSGGSLCRAAHLLAEAGAAEVHAAVVHGVFSGNALEKITASPLKTLVCTDTIPMTENKKKCDKLTVLSVAPLLAGAIHAVHTGESISSFFEKISLSNNFIQHRNRDFKGYKKNKAKEAKKMP